MPHIKQILFDCDNTLVLSEKIAFEACAELANEIFIANDRDTRYTGPKLLKDFVGQNFRGMLTSLQAKYDLKIPDMETYVSRELETVIKGLEERGEPCVGSVQMLQQIYDSRKYGMAVVSSSALPRVRASIKKVGQDKFFPYEHVYSAASSLPEPTSKPNPAVYIHACKQIGARPAECVAVEDSKSGATAAMNAGIPLIGYVGAYQPAEQEETAQMLREKCGAIAIMYDWSGFWECLDKVERAAVPRKPEQPVL